MISKELQNFIKDNVLGPGAKIEIIRSGDVIPYVNKVLSFTIILRDLIRNNITKDNNDKSIIKRKIFCKELKYKNLVNGVPKKLLKITLYV